jgi:hypothetical protein
MRAEWTDPERDRSTAARTAPLASKYRWPASGPGCSVYPVYAVGVEDTMHRWQQTTTLALGLTLTATPTVAQDKFELPLSSLSAHDGSSSLRTTTTAQGRHSGRLG